MLFRHIININITNNIFYNLFLKFKVFKIWCVFYICSTSQDWPQFMCSKATHVASGYDNGP